MSAQETNPETVGFRLSPQQERLLEARERGVAQCAAAVTPGEAELRERLEGLASAHEILRTTFPRPLGMRARSQVIHESLAPEWTARRLRAGETLEAAMEEQADRPFDLDHGPLLRALLLIDRSVLVLTAHGACADAQSLLVIAEGLGRNCAYAEVSSQADPVQYADYAEWRHELVTGEDADRSMWATEVPAAPRILFDGAGAGTGAAVGAGHGHARGRTRATPVALSGSDLDVLPEFVEACWHALIARLTGESELVLSGWCDGRGQPDLAGAIGPYSQPVPIRTRIEQETTFVEVLDQVRRGRAEAARGQDFAAAEDLRALERPGFVHLESDIAGSDIATVNPTMGAPLLLAFTSDRLTLWHDRDVHDAREAEEIAERLRILALSAAADPERPVAQLAVTEPAERAHLVARAAGPAPAADAGTPVHLLFERQAALTPDAPAVADAHRQLTYRELNRSANRLARLLGDAGPVALCMERTTALLEAVLGVLKAGAAYVPLNYEHPPARLAHQLSQSAAKIVLTEEHLLDRLPGFAGEIVCVDRDRERIAAYPSEDPEPAGTAEDLVYVMYTSGSTGLPKGVAVTHANLSTYATDMAERLGAGGKRFGVVSAISTDLANTCIFPALIAGGCVQLISPAAAMDAGAMADELGGRRLDVLKITPSHLGSLLAGDGAAAVLPGEWLVLGGESLSWELVARIRELAPTTRILNHYGPTEATVGCCAYEVEQPRADCATVPVGHPLAGARAYVLDRFLEPLPVGVPGELCIGGDGVAAGYLDGSAPAFVNDPFAGGRMYRTGDRGRLLRDGAIEFLGRVDDQVKLRGYRIEPGEIEAALLRHAAVRQAAVVALPDSRGETRLVAYIASSSDPDAEELRAFLARSLPDYMIPSAFATLRALPFTASGKIDRRALPRLTEAQTRRRAEYVAPRDAIEEEIAAIWAGLLGVEEVGVFDDFFALGGHSLLATQAIMRIRRSHGDIPLRALLAAPTVAALADVVRAGRT